jgi:hypothetical protein
MDKGASRWSTPNVLPSMKSVTINPFFPRLRSGHRLFQGPPAESKVLAAGVTKWLFAQRRKAED